MGFWSGVADALVPGRKARAMIVPSEDWPGIYPTPWAGWPTNWHTPRWNDNGSFSDETWTRVATVFACVDLISRSLGQMPIRIMKAGLEVPDRPLWTYDPFPELYSSVTEFIDQVVVSLLLRGNAFVYSLNEYSTGYPRQMMIVDPDEIYIETAGGIPMYYAGPQRIPLERERLLHIRYLSWPEDPWGYGPLDALARQMSININLDKYASELAGSGAVPWGVLTTEQDLNREQAELLKERWLEASADRQGAPAILSGGLSLQPLSLRPADMAMLELSQMSDRRIAMAFGIQPFLLGIPIEGSSGLMQYANVTTVADLLWRLTLRPLANTLSTALSKWALPYGTEAVFDADSFTRPDPKTRAETLGLLIDKQVISTDEARRYQGLPPHGSDLNQEMIIQQPTQEVL